MWGKRRKCRARVLSLYTLDIPETRNPGGGTVWGRGSSGVHFGYVESEAPLRQSWERCLAGSCVHEFDLREDLENLVCESLAHRLWTLRTRMKSFRLQWRSFKNSTNVRAWAPRRPVPTTPTCPASHPSALMQPNGHRPVERS